MAIAVGTLSKLEEMLEVKHVQRTPFPKESGTLHHENKMYPKGLLSDATPRSVWIDGIGGAKLDIIRIDFGIQKAELWPLLPSLKSAFCVGTNSIARLVIDLPHQR